LRHHEELRRPPIPQCQRLHGPIVPAVAREDPRQSGVVDGQVRVCRMAGGPVRQYPGDASRLGGFRFRSWPCGPAPARGRTAPGSPRQSAVTPQ
jgi:hypothetical protein